MSLVDRILALPRPLLLALDVDGTLAPIVTDPTRAAIPVGVLDSLSRLADAPGVILALVTGRDLESLARLAPIAAAWRAAEHGAIVVAPDEEPTEPGIDEAGRRALDEFERWASQNATGAFIEVKPRAVAIHVRGLAEDEPHAAAMTLEAAERQARRLGLHIRAGRSVREVEVDPHDKGRAIEEIFLRSRAASVFFAGDDLTDLPAIEFATQSGIGAFVLSEERREAPIAGAAAIDGDAEIAALIDELCRQLA